MKKIPILFFALLFMMIGGCQKKGADNKNPADSSLATNEIVTELIREDVLTNTNLSGQPGSNEALTESISGGPLVAMQDKKDTDKPLPEEPVVGVDKTAKSDKNIKDVPIEVPQKTRPAVSKTSKKGTYLKVGNDQNGQSVSRNKGIKITTVVFSPVKNGRYVDFWIYAAPVSGKGNTVLLTHVRNIDIINGQAQFTRYWNGKNINGVYIKKGKYRLFVNYTVKDSDKEPLKKETRNWGGDKRFNVRLY